MKQKILFSVLLILTIAAGLKFTSLTSSIISKNDDNNTVISKDDIKSDAVYINSSDTFSFEPYSIVEKESAVPLITYDKPVGKIYMSDIINELFVYYSSYSELTAFNRPAGKSLTDSVMVDKYDLAYTEKFAYYNNNGDLRYVDFIITTYSFELVYLNFYDDTNIQLSGSDIEKGVSNAEEYLYDFADSLNNIDVVSWLFADPLKYDELDEDIWSSKEWSDYYEKYEINDEDHPDRNSVKNSLHTTISAVSDYIYSNESAEKADPYSRFFRHFSLPSVISYRFWSKLPEGEEFTDEYGIYHDSVEAWMNITGTENIIYALNTPSSEDNDALKITEYSALKGRIYQVVSTQYKKRLIIIFNPKTQLVEGIFSDITW